MRTILLSSAMVVAMSASAFAQEHPSAKTLDEQLSRVQQGEPAVSGEWKEPAKKPMPVKTAPGGEWPADPALSQRKPVNKQMPAAVAPAAKPVAAQQPAVAPVVAQPAPAPLPIAPDGQIIDSVGGGAIPALPLQAQKSGDVMYLTGGIGDEEMAQLKAEENNYNVRIMMSATGGAYIGDVMVRVIDDKGAVVATSESAGPYFYIQLPAGTYVVEMTSRAGGIKKATVKAPAKAFVKQNVVFAE